RAFRWPLECAVVLYWVQPSACHPTWLTIRGQFGQRCGTLSLFRKGMRGLSKCRYSSTLYVAVLLNSHAGQQEEAMFISKQRPIAIPQWEHQKLAGTLALLWGNAASGAR